MKYWSIFFGIIITVIFGGGFFIKFLRDGNVHLIDFIGGCLGLIVLTIGIFVRGTMKPDSSIHK
ncbi:hypothetical protein ERJ70_14280 [Sediminibacillus dalangtanensis]|uniref:Uncharacterized protein n=1 Tax=Sediminibacillus dalangtanensis TaxID=2729421 RepID=A0ABX7VXT9_9BACI|nr:hypothetical protein [Sediminibacillus dalangtanensis]QTN00364.1 hypothetical protein ERJ70_14280 [Sediminibacillus dalangtanensis]